MQSKRSWVVLLLAVVLLVGCAVVVPSSGVVSKTEETSSVAGSVQSEEAAVSETASKAAEAGQTEKPAPLSDVEKYPQDGPYYVPFLPGEPPALPEGTRTPVREADMQALFESVAKNGTLSWNFFPKPEFVLDEYTVLQYRFEPENQCMLGYGIAESDTGLFAHGKYRFLQDGLVEATVWAYDNPADSYEDTEGVKSPVYLNLFLEWAGEDRETVLVSLQSLEDATPDKNFDYAFHNMIGVPIPFALY